MEEKKTQLPEDVTDTTPEQAAEPEKKLFTQEEVNKIIANKLERLRKQAAEEQAEANRAELEQIKAEIEQSRAELSARETVLQCKEYVQKQGYPPKLIDIINTDNYQEFKEKADMLAGIKWQENRVAPLMSTEKGYYDPTNTILNPQKHIYYHSLNKAAE